MQLCANSVQDRVSNNELKFPPSKTVCMYFCNQRKKYAELKVVRETKFLGVVFDYTLSFKNHVDYLIINCLKALDILKVAGF